MANANFPIEIDFFFPVVGPLRTFLCLHIHQQVSVSEGCGIFELSIFLSLRIRECCGGSERLSNCVRPVLCAPTTANFIPIPLCLRN
jgi:hypothetical protein